MTCHNRLLSEEDTECPDDKFIVHVVTVVLVWPELVGDEMNYELVIWTPGSIKSLLTLPLLKLGLVLILQSVIPIFLATPDILLQIGLW